MYLGGGELGSGSPFSHLFTDRPGNLNKGAAYSVQLELGPDLVRQSRVRRL